MSSLGIFDKETKTYQKVAGTAEAAVVDAEMSDTSTNPVQNKVIKSYVDGRTSSVAWDNITGKPSTYTPSSHTHDDRYYTESEVDSKLNSKANSSHTHTIANITNLKSALDGKAASSHTHSSVNDIDNGSDITFAYSKNGLDYDNYTWLAGWNHYELRAVNKNQFATASDYEHIQGEIDNLKKSVSDGKTKVANAITDKGVETATDATFDVMANNISQIETGKKYSYGSCGGIPSAIVTVRNYPSILASINTGIKGVSPELVVVQLNSLSLCFKKYVNGDDVGLFNSTIAITDKGLNKIINPTPNNIRKARFTIDPVYNSNTGFITLNTSVYFELGDIDGQYLDQYNIKYYADSLNWYLIY